MDEDWDDNSYSAPVVSDLPSTGRSFGGRGRGFLPAENKNGGFKKDFNSGDRDSFGNQNGGNKRNFGDNNGFKKGFDNDDNGGRGRRNFGGDDDGERRGGRRNFGGDDDGERRGGGRRNFGGDDDGERRGGGRRNFGGDDDGERRGGGRRNFGGDDDGERRGGGGRRNFGGDDDGERRGGGRRNFGGDDDGERRGGGRRNFGGDDDNDRGGNKFGVDNDGDGEVKVKARTYIPPTPTEDETELYESSVSSGINFSKYNDIPVKVTGDDVPPPIDSFQKAGLRPFVLEQVAKCGYKTPTPIQKYALPCIMNGRDVMACAQTGSGKTAAFLLPIVQNLLANHESSSVDGNCVAPQALIISPTRELSIQIWEESRKFIRGSGVQSCIIYGGTQVYHQIDQLMKGANILVATPGRLNDFVSRNKIVFDKIRFVVLDEADRMLDMGFKGDIEKVMTHPTMVPKGERQTLMFSATFPETIQRMAGQYLNRYLFIAVGQVGGACSDVEQRILQVARNEKKDKLIELLSAHGGDKTVIFVETKRQADILSVVLCERQFPTTSIHGDRDQCQREQAINDFKRGRMSILVATAVASRGLDIKDVRHVINYDMPKEIDEYVHRIGRTGRLGNRGLATSFYDPDKDSEISSALVNILGQACQEVPDFLQGGGSYHAEPSSSYGGNDFRGGSDAIESEEW